MNWPLAVALTAVSISSAATIIVPRILAHKEKNGNS